MSLAWSPDSKWIAYTLTNKASFQTLRLYSLDQGKSFPLTDGLAEVAEPVFDASGKYLYFLASTDAGPIKQWFDQSNADVQATHSVFLAVLARSTPNPLIKPTDEEADKPTKADKDKDKDKKKDEPKATVIDLDGIESRIVALPIPGGNLSATCSAGEEGKIYYVRRVGMIPGKTGDAFAGTSSLVRFDLKTREEETLAEKVDGFKLSGDRKKVLYHSKEIVGDRRRRQVRRRQGRAADRGDLGQGRPPGRVGRDAPGGLADQSRLLLRQGDARRRLAGDAGQVRQAPARGPHPRRPQPGDPGDVQRAGRGPQLPPAAATCSTSPSRSPSASSAPITRSPRGVIGSRRSTAA